VASRYDDIYEYELDDDDSRYVFDSESETEQLPVDEDDTADNETADRETAVAFQEYQRKLVASKQLEESDITDRTLVVMAKNGCTLPPVSERADIIEHLMGHYGRRAMATRIIRSGKYWPTLHADIREAIDTCSACSAVEARSSGFHPARTINAPLPGDHYQIDLATLPKSEDGFRYLFVLVDVFTGFLMLKPLTDKRAPTIARALWEVCSVIGFPRVLQSDNGKEFVNGIVRALVSLYGIQHRTIAAYNPRADGKVERSIRTVKKTLMKLLHGATVYWPLHLPFVQFSYNDKVQDVTGATAFSLMFGRLPNEPNSYVDDTLVDLPPASAEWKAHQEKLVSLIFPAINSRREAVQDKYRQRMDSIRRKLVQHTLAPGTVVMIKNPLYLATPSLRPASEPQYIGPFTIQRRSHYGPYYLLDEMEAPYPRPVPLDQMKVVRKKRGAGDDGTESGSSLAEVDRVLAHKVDKATGALLYRVQWKDGSRNQWVPAEGLNATHLVSRYYQERELIRNSQRLARKSADMDEEHDID
jgi:transposase InsO family protein